MYADPGGDRPTTAEGGGMARGEERPRPGLWSLAATLVAVCGFWAVAAPFIWESNGGIVFILLSLVVAWPVVAWLCIARWGGLGGLRLGFSILAVPATLIGLFLLFHLEIAGLTWLLHRRPPPRPMFCNDFVDDERALLPYWYPAIPVVDRFGHWGWADYGDNLLVVVVTGVPVTARSGAVSSGLNECRIRAGDDREDRFVTLKRTRNALVVILPDGSVGQFPLGAGLAEQYHKARQSRHVSNVLREAGELLDPAPRQEFDRFLAEYHEPTPK